MLCPDWQVCTGSVTSRPYILRHVERQSGRASASKHIIAKALAFHLSVHRLPSYSASGNRMEEADRWKDLDRLLTRPGQYHWPRI